MSFTFIDNAEYNKGIIEKLKKYIKHSRIKRNIHNMF